MILKDYLKGLNELAKEHPELMDKKVIYSGDDEGNYYQDVYYNASVGHQDDSGMFHQEDEAEKEGKEINCVCMN